MSRLLNDGAALVDILHGSKEITSLCQNFPGLCTARVLAIYRTYVARRGSSRCCVGHLYGGQPEGTNTNEPWI